MIDREPTRPVPVLDVEHLHLVCSDDRDFEREIIGDFLAQAEASIVRLAETVAHRDAKALRFAAHALTGSSRSLGAVALGNACHRLEEIGGSGELDAAPAALETARIEWDRLREAIRVHLDSLAA